MRNEEGNTGIPGPGVDNGYTESIDMGEEKGPRKSRKVRSDKGIKRNTRRLKSSTGSTTSQQAGRVGSIMTSYWRTFAKKLSQYIPLGGSSSKTRTS